MSDARTTSVGWSRARVCAGRRGMTLLEVLIAVAIFAMLMTALATFILSMGEVWGRGEDERNFRRHARAVSHFLAESMREAVVTSASGPGGGRVILERPEGVTGGDPLLTWQSVDSPAIVDWPGVPLPDVRVRLQLKPREGLFLLAESVIERPRTGRVEPREVQVSEYVRRMEYEYYDAGLMQWTRAPAPRQENGEPQVPRRLRLTFELGTWTEETVVQLPPVAASGRLLF